MILSLNKPQFFGKELSIRDDTAFYRRFTPGTIVHKYFKAQAGKNWKNRPKDIDGNPIWKIGEGVVVGNYKVKLYYNSVYFSANQILGDLKELHKIILPLGLSRFICDPDLLERFAHLECFDSWQEMKEYFKLDEIQVYKGRLILWKNINYKPILQQCACCGKADEIQLLERLKMGRDGKTGIPYPDFWYHGRCAK